MTEVPKSNAVDKAYNAIRSAIMAGTFVRGSHLKEEVLAASIGVSRTPVREALRRLDAEGLVTFSPHRGAHLPNWDAQDVEEIFGLRAVLESHAAERAASRVTADQLAELKVLAETMCELERDRPNDFIESIAEYNDRFHKLVLAASNSARLTAMLSSLIQIPMVLRTFRRYSEEDLRRSLGHHLELAAALGARDGEWAGSVMRSHVLAARRVFQVHEGASLSD